MNQVKGISPLALLNTSLFKNSFNRSWRYVLIVPPDGELLSRYRAVIQVMISTMSNQLAPILFKDL